MQIVLLSGGSGKRLWPLSNEIRSKQFIPLFDDSKGGYESMLQRVYGQIRSVSEGTAITIATSKSQVAAIRHQIGDGASICVEPCRKDTFPAIALACAYLKHEMGADENECVAVCPIDPYVDPSYFSTVLSLEDVIRSKGSGLALMGIEPTYPSEKYGYIIPESKDAVSRVSCFREKPAVADAREFISRGALWNAGVFAFRLGYLLDIAHAAIPFEDYRDLYAKYAGLEKISFDYAVVEKEKDILVKRYGGEWKDVGTWNTLCEVMDRPVKGKALLDEACVDSNVINELDIPVLGMGLKNVVVAACIDGIYVADKERSGYMKPYVDKVSEEARFADKSWGEYTVIDIQNGSRTVKISLNAGSRMSYHSHAGREEVWTVLSGTGKTYIEDMEQTVRPGDVVTISRGCKHTITADTDMSLIEIQIGEDLTGQDKTVYKFPIE